MSPTPSIHSCTATNPNTPLAEDEIDRRVSRGTRCLHVPSSNDSSLSSDNSGGIYPTWPATNVDITHAPALALWQPSNRLENVFLDVHWIPGSTNRGAFFKVHTRVKLDVPSTGRSRHRNGVRVFVFIPPERIRQLHFDPDPKEFVGRNTIALTFDMLRPPALVLPKTFASPDQPSNDRIKSLRILTTQTSFTVHASIADRRFPARWIRQLCIAISAHQLPSISRLAFAIIPSLYEGQGGQILEGDCLSEIDAGVTNTPVPPAYDSAVANTSPPTFSSRGRKRGRSSPATEVEVSSRPMKRAVVEALQDARLQEHRDALISEVMKLLAMQKKEIVQILAAEFAEKLASSEERVRENVLDGLESSIDEKFSSKEEAMQEAIEDAVMDRLTSMPLRADLTFPLHPIY